MVPEENDGAFSNCQGNTQNRQPREDKSVQAPSMQKLHPACSSQSLKLEGQQKILNGDHLPKEGAQTELLLVPSQQPAQIQTQFNGSHKAPLISQTSPMAQQTLPLSQGQQIKYIQSTPSQTKFFCDTCQDFVIGQPWTHNLETHKSMFEPGGQPSLPLKQEVPHRSLETPMNEALKQKEIQWTCSNPNGTMLEGDILDVPSSPMPPPPCVWCGHLAKGDVVMCRVSACHLGGATIQELVGSTPELINIKNRTDLNTLPHYVPLPQCSVFTLDPSDDSDRGPLRKFYEYLLHKNRAGMGKLASCNVYLIPTPNSSPQAFGLRKQESLLLLVVPAAYSKSSSAISVNNVTPAPPKAVVQQPYNPVTPVQYALQRNQGIIQNDMQIQPPMKTGGLGIPQGDETSPVIEPMRQPYLLKHPLLPQTQAPCHLPAQHTIQVLNQSQQLPPTAQSQPQQGMPPPLSRQQQQQILSKPASIFQIPPPESPPVSTISTLTRQLPTNNINNISSSTTTTPTKYTGAQYRTIIGSPQSTTIGLSQF